MNQKYISIWILAAASLAACGNVSKNANETGAASGVAGGTGPFGANEASPAPASAVSVVSDSTHASALPPTTGATSGAVNPPHGQPGHTCDIPVGAPMSSKPTAGATRTISPGGTVVTPSVTPSVMPTVQTPISVTQPSGGTATPSKGAAGGTRLNPPHGQPGHDCAVTVGAPLP